MARPRSNNLRQHIDWAKTTQAFTASYSFVDSPEFRRSQALGDLPATNGTDSQFANEKRALNESLAIESTWNHPARTASNCENANSSLPTPPSHSNLDADLDSDSDSDLEYLAHLSEPSKTSNSAAKAPEFSENHAREEAHVIETSSGPNTPQHFHGIPDSEPATSPNQAFRFSQAPLPMDLEPPRRELGSVFSEKIALLEQKIKLLSLELSSRNIHCDTVDVDEKIREVDRRIEEFSDDEDAVYPQNSGMHLSSSPQVARAGLPNYINNDQFDSDYIDFVDDGNFTGGHESFNEAGNEPSRQESPADRSYGDYMELDSEKVRTDDLGKAQTLANSDDIQILGCSQITPKQQRDVSFELSNSNPLHDDSEIIGTEPLPGSTQRQMPALASQHVPATPSQPAYATQAWTKEMMHILRTRFGLQGFRPNQAEAVNETLAGNDVVVLMPTGGGKSLCYQLPALVTTGSTRGTTVVISPLISLMQDQVYHLKNRSIQAEMLNSRLSATERSAVFALLNSGDLQLLYISPEMLSASSAMQSALRRLYLNNRLARIVIDEAHCVSSWGHDFRPEYMELTKVKNEFPATPIMALTATANERVLLDIVGCLRSNPIVLKQSFNRRNLYYEVRPKAANIISEVAGVCRMYRGKSGIIYCHSKRNCEETAAKLRQTGVAAEFYHAGMTQERRAAVQQDWQTGRCSVVCATIAFGMGIDKPDVRYVMHMTLPRNIEGYYQETGRAGRDGKQSHCILFYSYRDVQMLQKMIQQDRQLAAHIRDHHRTLLVRVMQYCENKTDCRRQQVLQYFNEDFSPQLCHQQCDNCRNMRNQGVIHRDMTAEAKHIVQIVQQITAQHVTTQQVTDVLLGRKTRKSKSCGFDNMPWFGALHALGPLLVERLVHALVSERVIEEYSQYNHSRYPQSYIRLGQSAMQVMHGSKPVQLSMPRDADGLPASAPAPEPVNKRRARGGSRFRNPKRVRS